MIADIAVGHHAAADVCFLIAVILAGVAALASVRPVQATPSLVWAPILGWAAVAVLSLGWLLL